MNDVVISYFTAVLFVSGVMSSVPIESDQQYAPECTSWNGIKKHLEDADSISCSIIDECAGVNCSGQYNGHDVRVEVVVEPCATPPTLNTTFDIPFLNIHNMHHTLKDGDVYKFPHFTDALNLYVAVSLKKENQTILLSLTLKPEITLGDTLLPPVPLLSNATIYVRKCHEAGPHLVSTKKPRPNPSSSKPTRYPAIIAPPLLMGKKCNAANVTECSENEICVQVAQGFSECSCKNGFVRNDNQECMPVLSLVGTSCDLQDLERTCGENEVCVQDSEDNSTGHCYCRQGYHNSGSGVCVPGSPTANTDKTFVIVTACIVPIVVLLLCSVAGFLAYKFRLIPRLRQRYTNVRTYEVMSIGEDDVEPLVA